jgi:hypothetical protein
LLNSLAVSCLQADITVLEISSQLHFCIIFIARKNMRNTKDKNQIVVRITDKLNKKIEKASESKGLTKASWVRQLIIETLDDAESAARP